MTKLVWDKLISRSFETGVDRGVLYPLPTNTGITWNGLIHVDESPVVAGNSDYYIDSFKYTTGKTVESYSGILEAITYPDEFVEGLFFNLCYRTMINDSDYFLHILYNLRASLPEKVYQTIGSSNTPAVFTWNLDAIPVDIPRLKPTPYVLIDSRTTSKSLILEIEKIIYGTATTEPRLPYPPELIDIFKAWVSGYGHGPYGHGAYGGN